MSGFLISNYLLNLNFLLFGFIEFMIQQNKFRLISSSILKVMNFLIFRDFSRIFLYFSEFILDLFRFQNKKIIIFIAC